MKLIVGLGNPGAKYNFTRHNFGFLALDFYFKTHKLNWEEKPRLSAVAGRSGDTWFIKPQDFYNNSGKAVREFMRYYKIAPEDILVICDNFDLEFGKMRYRAAGSAGGNNGLKSIDAELGTSEYARLRLGTGNDALRRQMGDIDFVLSRFTPEEKARLPEILTAACEKIDEWSRN
ncbi:aminoacyl-tRNA hydrolase [Candidatus Saccharibacteria bacterium]|nr:aminoacyl-tRNA hydrolase [Candidatus Saccharibacteria bacterium]